MAHIDFFGSLPLFCLFVLFLHPTKQISEVLLTLHSRVIPGGYIYTEYQESNPNRAHARQVSYPLFLQPRAVEIYTFSVSLIFKYFL